MRALLLALIMPMLACAKTQVSFLFSYDPNHPEYPATRAILDLVKKDPSIEPVKWGGITLPGGGGRATFTLALAGGSAPDIYMSWFHVLRHDISQGFVYPLDEWVKVSEKPADLWDEVRTCDGKVWALPAVSATYYGILYRKDLVAEAGLEPANHPRTWDEFERWCVKLTQTGRRAFAVENRPWGFLPWVQAAGGDVICNTPDGWKASFSSKAAVNAAKFLQRLKRRGVIRGMPVLSVADDIGKLFVSGEIVAVFGGEDLVLRLTEVLGFPSELIGIMPFPSMNENLPRVMQAHRHFYAMSESVARRPKEARDLVFKCLSALASTNLSERTVHNNVAEGRAAWCKPSDLKRLGYEKLIEKIPPEIREMYEDLESGRIKAVTEPWVGFWQGASDLVQRKFLGVLLSDEGDNMDVEKVLAEIDDEANRGLMFNADKSRIEKARPYARGILAAILISLLISLMMIWRAKKSSFVRVENENVRDSRVSRIIPWLFLLPAIASIALWSYYPLFKGALMAFQNYHIVGDSEWAGLDNFISVAIDPMFWKAWLRTLEYVIITLLIGFVTPVILAVMLWEIPRGRIFFRFLYFLPHLTSALVVTLLWKLMFDPTENGILNQILASVGIARQSFLQDPSMAMVCCIIPGVWAGAGISSLIYIAALGSLPHDYYEAAAIDGAGIFSRIIHVTLPQIAPLMVINFVGSFIAAFQGMGSIFLLTFGGPGDATQVLSLQIWKEAYNNLRFSTATTMAWFLGVALIGFTYLQIRFLRRVEFRRAQ